MKKTVIEVAPCTTCETILPVTEFYTQRHVLKSGEVVYYRKNKCKACMKEVFKKNYITRKAIKEYNRISEERALQNWEEDQKNRSFFQRARDLLTKWF